MSRELIIREALPSDVDVIFKWSNDPLVREQSFSSEKISYDSHCEWYSKKLVDKNSHLYIVEEKERRLGLVRFHKDNKEAVIGVVIDRDYRGQGYGAKLIKIGLEKYFDFNSLMVLAFIKKDNTASIRAFEKARFEYLKNDTINGVESVVYQIKMK